ncbi:MAG: hypothetical protein ABI539_09165 [Acidobacteriota bacterium]
MLVELRETSSSLSGRQISGSFPLRRSHFAFCPVCDKGVELYDFEVSAQTFNTDVQDIGSLARRGDLHRLHTIYGEVMICSDSLFTCFERRQTRILTDLPIG